MKEKAKIAIGPARPFPSWNWIGKDTARELKKYFTVEIFEGNEIPLCDLALVIKEPLSSELAERLVEAGSKIIFVPVDFYQSEESIRKNASFLKFCSALLLHCDRLRPHLEPYCDRIGSIDHHNKFGLQQPAEFHESGDLLWIGGFQYVPYILKWLQSHSMPHSLKLVTDFKAGGVRARTAAQELSVLLGVEWKIKDGHINSIPVVEWSEESQHQAMIAAKAAFDVKGGRDSFNQFTKPPTKAQKYICSGIPFACNSEAYAREYFFQKGFDIADLADSSRWLSRHYWQETQDFGADLRKELSLESVGWKLKNDIEKVLAC